MNVVISNSKCAVRHVWLFALGFILLLLLCLLFFPSAPHILNSTVTITQCYNTPVLSIFHIYAHRQTIKPPSSIFYRSTVYPNLCSRLVLCTLDPCRVQTAARGRELQSTPVTFQLKHVFVWTSNCGRQRTKESEHISLTISLSVATFRTQ